MAARGPKRSRSGRLLDAAVWGVARGGAGGGVLGAAVAGLGAAIGAVLGAAVYAAAEVLTTRDRPAAQPKPLFGRILGSVLLMALFGRLLGLVLGGGHTVLVAVVSGGLLRLPRPRPLNGAPRLLVGAAGGPPLHALAPGVGPRLAAAPAAL